MSRTRKPPPVALFASPEDTEAQFYEALQQGDIERLMAVWADDEDIVCVHPGGPRLIGRSAIRNSFDGIFANGAIPASPEQVHRMQTMTTAVHHLAERVSVATSEGTRTAWVLATNVYLKTEEGWRMVVHHASPGTVGERPAVVGEAPTLLH